MIHLKKPWNFPWKYFMSFFIVLILLAIGAFIEYVFNGTTITLPVMPYNIYLMCIYMAVVIFIHFRYRNKPLIEWLSSTPAAISAIFGYITCLFCMGYFPQNQNQNELLNLTGISHVKRSFPFILINIYLITCIILIILRRINIFKLTNLWFFLNHFGLLVIIISTGLGSGDVKRVNINLLENEEESNIGITNNGDMYQLPFTIKLLDFTLDEYYPNIYINDSAKGESSNITENIAIKDVIKKQSFIIKNWYVRILAYIPNAFYLDSAYTASDIPGSCPAAYLEIINLKKKTYTKSWISSGSFNQKNEWALIAPQTYLVLTNPMPKNRTSLLTISKDSLNIDTLTLQINRPLKVGSWKLYQTGYDKSKGKWSTLSIIEAVHDPWYKITIVGLAMLIVGMTNLLFLCYKLDK